MHDLRNPFVSLQDRVTEFEAETEMYKKLSAALEVTLHEARQRSDEVPTSSSCSNIDSCFLQARFPTRDAFPSFFLRHSVSFAYLHV